MPQTIIELGQRVKQKYPEYADLDDAEVGRRVKEKYPSEYADFSDVASSPIPPQSLFQRIASYMPSTHAVMTGGGAAIGGALGGAGATILGTPISTVPGAMLGGATGASIGESLYQLGQHLT